ncbi:hypothetical protein FXF53_21585 [Micromonospora sp. WP24]|nr:hypothetical protein FXF53_21585 [Micromonospora sp. WP24]
MAATRPRRSGDPRAGARPRGAGPALRGRRPAGLAGGGDRRRGTPRPAAAAGRGVRLGRRPGRVRLGGHRRPAGRAETAGSAAPPGRRGHGHRGGRGGDVRARVGLTRAPGSIRHGTDEMRTGWARASRSWPGGRRRSA